MAALTGFMASSVSLRRRLVPLGIAPVVAVLVLVAILEGDLPETAGYGMRLAGSLVRHFGAPGSVALLYLEESGVPLPVPGDVYVLYLGHLAAGSALRWVAAWLAIVAAVVAGSSNLYLISHRWGRRVVEGRLGALIHLTPSRLARAEGWFGRWGAVAIIFGRHVPGFRVPVTVAAGIFQVRYRTFAASVAISTAAWAAFWLYLGARFGTRVGRFLHLHRWTYAVMGIVVALAIVFMVFRALRHAHGSRASAQETDPGEGGQPEG